jgi:hypothetical protein
MGEEDDDDYLDIGGMSQPSEGQGAPLGRALQQGACIMIASRAEASFILKTRPDLNKLNTTVY